MPRNNTVSTEINSGTGTTENNFNTNTGDLFDLTSSNMNKIMRAMKWNKSTMAEKTGVSPATMSGYLGDGVRSVVPSVGYLISLCKNDEIKKAGIRFTINDFLSSSFDPELAVKSAEHGGTNVTRDDLCDNFSGNYLCYFFDQSKPLTENDEKSSRPLRYGVVSIFYIYDIMRATNINVVFATFYKQEELKNAIEFKQLLDKQIYNNKKPLSHEKIISLLGNSFEKEASENQHSTYSGELSFEGDKAFVNIISKVHNDHALMIFNTTAKRQDGKYIGGCGTMASVSRGNDHMPTAQKIIISRHNLHCSNEILAEHLSLASAPISPDTETESLLNLCEKLYTSDKSKILGFSQKDISALIHSRMTQLIQHYIEKNICCVASVSNEEDKKVYNLIKDSIPKH